jgi:hypothetical protein
VEKQRRLQVLSFSICTIVVWSEDELDNEAFIEAEWSMYLVLYVQIQQPRGEGMYMISLK